MPKNEIDYSNTIIYKITCNDSNVTDKYVGQYILTTGVLPFNISFLICSCQ